MKKFVLPVLLLFTFNLAHSLEIDEKLTARFLRVSKTKKTILLNRGLEDGLVVGDHAKFFLTTGVIARGTVVKASPTRSIWAIYRIIDSNSIYGDRVVNIKISKSLKITDDPSKSLRPEKYAMGQTERMGIPLAEGADDVQTSPQLTEAERKDMESLGKVPGQFDSVESYGIHSNKKIEVWGMIHMNNLAVNVDRGETSGSLDGTMGDFDFSLGIEKYFTPGAGFLPKISLSGFIHKSSTQTIFTTGTTNNDILEYGAAFSWHFMAPPLTYGKLIGFATAGAGIGTTTDTLSTEVAGVVNESVATGSLSFLYAGFGFKYFTERGLGARATVDLYNRAEELTCDTTPCSGSADDTYTKTVVGPRIQMGISYRF